MKDARLVRWFLETWQPQLNRRENYNPKSAQISIELLCAMNKIVNAQLWAKY